MAASGCSSISASGPSTRAVKAAGGTPTADGAVHVIDVSDEVALRLRSALAPQSFAESLGDAPEVASVIGKGDGVEVTIWEAPPAVLFGTGLQAGQAGAASGSRSNDLPIQIVGSDGKIDVPFAGTILAAGRTPTEIARDIRSRLASKAHDPQVIVRLSRNATANVAVVGEIANSLRMPLTAKGERLLDALAAGGGVRQPVGKMTVQLTRGAKVSAMPLEQVIKNPRENIRLKADDVVTLLFQPYSFTVLGAARANQEVPFEGTGLTLSQALGRIGGLDDQRADPKGVFIFRFEDTAGSPETSGDGTKPSNQLRTPTIYRVNMRDPKTLFAAQAFPIKDKDIIYISNAPLADFSKFLQALSQIVYPIATVQNANIF